MGYMLVHNIELCSGDVFFLKYIKWRNMAAIDIGALDNS
jgi:hypothetical protein